MHRTNMDEQRKSKREQLMGVWAGIVDLRFDRYLTMQLLPVFYLLLLIAASALAFLAVVAGFGASPLAGLITLVAAPFALLLVVVIIRAALEYMVMAHRIMRIIERMDALNDTIHGVSARVDNMDQHVDRVADEFVELNQTLTLLRPLLESASLPSKLFSKARDSISSKEIADAKQKAKPGAPEVGTDHEDHRSETNGDPDGGK